MLVNVALLPGRSSVGLPTRVIGPRLTVTPLLPLGFTPIVGLMPPMVSEAKVWLVATPELPLMFSARAVERQGRKRVDDVRCGRQRGEVEGQAAAVDDGCRLVGIRGAEDDVARPGHGYRVRSRARVAENAAEGDGVAPGGLRNQGQGLVQRDRAGESQVRIVVAAHAGYARVACADGDRPGDGHAVFGENGGGLGIGAALAGVLSPSRIASLPTAGWPKAPVPACRWREHWPRR